MSQCVDSTNQAIGRREGLARGNTKAWAAPNTVGLMSPPAAPLELKAEGVGDKEIAQLLATVVGQLDEVERMLSLHQDEIHELQRRINPILRPDAPPTDCGESALGTPEACPQTPLGGFLRAEIIDRIFAVQRSVRRSTAMVGTVSERVLL